MIAARRPTNGEAAAAAIRASGGEARFVPADVTRPQDAERMVRTCLAEFGGLDFAFNNAGTGRGGRVDNLSEEDFDTVFAVNVKGLWLSMKYELAWMRSRGAGAIVNNVSVHGFRAVFPGVAAYVASKHAAVALTRVAALENSAAGIRVNGVAPGPIDTEMLRSSEATVGGARAWVPLIPAGRVGHPDEVASVALWLFSDSSSYVAGEIVAVDGGFLAS
jgi:NAD(P)-dependent dehydrogenase (short-subunit alcohol dehydrogenase family)